MSLKRSLFSAAALAALGVQSVAVSAQNEKPGSLHIQCDGNPNNVTAGETAARLVGAVTLLGLFAPPMEGPDASKRKTGAEGVAICSTLIDGPRAEGNAKRRIGLILARAIHKIEAKDLPGAQADVQRARSEAEAAGLMNDAYYARSRGRTFDTLEGAILARMGKFEEARAIALRPALQSPYSVPAQFAAGSYNGLIRSASSDELRSARNRTRFIPAFGFIEADRLLVIGQFAEAAKLYDALAEIDSENSPDSILSSPPARAAIAHALAGNREVAAQRMAVAKANFEKRKTDGKPESEPSNIIELMDFYAIIKSADDGDLASARRSFAARSQWTVPGTGAVMALSDRLRQGAAPSELFGALAKSGDQLWSEAKDEIYAKMIAKDDDNSSLYGFVYTENDGSGLRALSKPVWRTDKSKMILAPKKASTSKMETLYYYYAGGTNALEAYLLHGALLAKARGHQGFIYDPIFVDNIVGASIRTGNRGTKGLTDPFFIDAAEVITALRPFIPSPDDLKAAARAQR